MKRRFIQSVSDILAGRHRSHVDLIQLLVGVAGGGNALVVGIVNLFIAVNEHSMSFGEALVVPSVGLIIAEGILWLGCGFWNSPVARWTHVTLFVVTAYLSALDASDGNLTSAFFIVFAIVLLAEYNHSRRVAVIAGSVSLAGYLPALLYGLLQDEVSLLRMVPIMATLASMLVLFGGVAVFHRMRRKQSEEELERRVVERTAELNAALAERTVMLQEIHHRVKNNMQTVSTLLGLEAAQLEDSAARRSLSASQDRIHTMAKVHDALYRSEHLDRIDLARYTQDLVDTMVQAAARPVETDLRLRPGLWVPLSFAASYGLVLHELYNNALEHAFGDSADAKITVSLEKRGDSLHLAVEDNGSGLPEDFSLDRPTSVGLTIVTSIVRHQGGTVEVDDSAGTHWLLSLPLRALSGDRR